MAQVLTGHAFDLVGFLQKCIQRAVFQQPLGSGFGTDLGHARHVVNRIAHQGLEINHQFGRYAKFVGHTGHVPLLAVHGVNDGDALVHQLTQVFVATGDHHIHAHGGGAVRQRGNHIISLNAGHIQQGPTQHANHAVNRFDLTAQVVRHG